MKLDGRTVAIMVEVSEEMAPLKSVLLPCKKSEYVVLSNDVGHTEVEGDSEILGTDVADETLWYAVPISAYGGGE
ncbi:hypothetical protein C8039_09730 [Halogeometricum sp. wsp3]|nr:hypothetical protein C8039_09730 [Halogeometricum sp. wsp3]